MTYIFSVYVSTRPKVICTVNFGHFSYFCLFIVIAFHRCYIFVLFPWWTAAENKGGGGGGGVVLTFALAHCIPWVSKWNNNGNNNNNIFGDCPTKSTNRKFSEAEVCQTEEKKKQKIGKKELSILFIVRILDINCNKKPLRENINLFLDFLCFFFLTEEQTNKSWLPYHFYAHNFYVEMRSDNILCLQLKLMKRKRDPHKIMFCSTNKEKKPRKIFNETS